MPGEGADARVDARACWLGYALHPRPAAAAKCRPRSPPHPFFQDERPQSGNASLPKSPPHPPKSIPNPPSQNQLPPQPPNSTPSPPGGRDLPREEAPKVVRRLHHRPVAGDVGHGGEGVEGLGARELARDAVHACGVWRGVVWLGWVGVGWVGWG